MFREFVKLVLSFVPLALVIFFIGVPMWGMYRDWSRPREGHWHEIIMPQIEDAVAEANDHDRSVTWVRATQAKLAKAEAKKKTIQDKHRVKRH